MKKILLLLGFLNLFGITFGQVYVSGLITKDSTWKTKDSLIIVNGNLKISSSGSLKIEPGVIIKINANAVIQIDGELIARGSENKKILFCSNNETQSKGSWQYLYFTNASKDAVYSTGVYSSGCILEYCILEYGGASNNGILFIDQASPYINNCAITNSSSSGIKINQGGPKISNTIIDNNTGDGIYLPNYQEHSFIVEKCVISNNGGKGIKATYGMFQNKASILYNEIFNNSGGIYFYQDGGSGSGYIDVIGNTIYNNRSSNGGGIYIARGYNMNVSKNIIKSNSATSNGGGLYFGEGFNPFTYYVTDNIFIANTASNGAAIYSTFFPTGGYKTDSYIRGNSFLFNSSLNSILYLDGYINQNNPLDYNPIKYYVENNSSSGNIASRLIVASKFLGYFRNNNFLDSQLSYIIENKNIAGKPDIDFSNNYLNGLSASEINNKIYDWLDNGSLSSVIYDPVNTSPNITSPITSPIGVFKRATSNGIELTWRKNKESDVKGYKIYSSPKNEFSYNKILDITTDTSIILTGISLTDTLVVSAFDNTADGINDQMDGNESWYSEMAQVYFKAALLSGKNYCKGGKILFQIGLNYKYDASNSFNLILSDTTGSFNNSIIIGQSNATSNFQFSKDIPDSLFGHSYRAIIKSTKPEVVSDTFSFTLNKTPVLGTIALSAKNICSNEIAEISCMGCQPEDVTYYWNFGGGNILSGSNAGPYRINWSWGGTKNIHLTLTKNGCTKDTSFSIHVALPPQPISICMVSVDSSDHNVVMWNNLSGTIDSVIIYKEISQTNNFIKIGSQSAKKNVFTDMLSNPAQKSDKYKISVKDICSNETAQSQYHKTIHLTINAGLNQVWNLGWDDYVGFSYSAFNIYRGTTKTDLIKIAEMPSNTYSFTDLTPPPGNVYYQIEVVNPSPCNVSLLKSSNIYNNSTRSNIVNSVKATSVSEINDDHIEIWPNPSDNKLNIQLENISQLVQVSILTLDGKILIDLPKAGFDKEIDVSHLNSGLYIIRLLINGKIINKKFIKK